MRLIVLNNIFMSNTYLNACHRVNGDMTAAQFNWLKFELAASRARNEGVWIICHEPPGVDLYGLLHGRAPECAGNVKDFIKPVYTDQFIHILLEWQDTVKGIFCGHTHMDEFRMLMADRDRAAVFFHLTPSVSPVFGNNPGFQRFDLDQTTGALLDYTTFFLDLGSQGYGTPKWQPSYTFSTTYGLDGINGDTLFKLRNAIFDDHGIREAYIRHFNTENPSYSQINDGDWKAFYQAITHLTPESYVKAYCRP